MQAFLVENLLKPQGLGNLVFPAGGALHLGQEAAAQTHLETKGL